MLIILGHLGVEAFAVGARHAAEGDEQWLVGALGLGTGGGEIVVNPEICVAGIFVLQHIEQLVLCVSHLAKRERCRRCKQEQEEGYGFHWHGGVDLLGG